MRLKETYSICSTLASASLVDLMQNIKDGPLINTFMSWRHDEFMPEFTLLKHKCVWFVQPLSLWHSACLFCLL